MATVSKEIAEKIIDADGHFADDPQVQAVVNYRSKLSGKYEFALIYPNESIQRYGPSEYIREPKFIWACARLRSQLIRHTHCRECKQLFTTANVKSIMAWRETQISGLCETCWDKVFAEPNEESREPKET